MEDFFRIAALCLVAAALAPLLQTSRIRLTLAIAVVAVVTSRLLLSATELAVFFSEVLALTGIAREVFTPLLKTLAIACTAKLTGSLCRDAGESALGALVDMAGAVCAVLVALPLLRAVLELMRSWL
ncbi:MAG: stage III sporulation AC/AD family protein [Oscillospiraceae bacterium]|nr:stage III sporulation AC/AD family protein [Oscillospiraceae bacterium]